MTPLQPKELLSEDQYQNAVEEYGEDSFRYGIGAELKPSYYQQAVRNLAVVDAEKPAEAAPLFDLEVAP